MFLFFMRHSHLHFFNKISSENKQHICVIKLQFVSSGFSNNSTNHFETI
jgi:hypothetical protein